jgi:hypothetical protein
MVDQVRDRGLALREPAHDTQPVDVGQRLVDEADGAQVVGLIDDGRDGRTDAGSGRAQGKLRWGWCRGRPERRRINGGLYQYALMRVECQEPAAPIGH